MYVVVVILQLSVNRRDDESRTNFVFIFKCFGGCRRRLQYVHQKYSITAFIGVLHPYQLSHKPQLHDWYSVRTSNFCVHISHIQFFGLRVWVQAYNFWLIVHIYDSVSDVSPGRWVEKYGGMLLHIFANLTRYLYVFLQMNSSIDKFIPYIASSDIISIHSQCSNIDYFW